MPKSMQGSTKLIDSDIFSHCPTTITYVSTIDQVLLISERRIRMSNYNAAIRTNYFSVKDSAALRKLIDSVYAEDTIELFMHELPNGSMQYGFGCYGTIDGIRDNEDTSGDDLYAFYKALQKLVCENDAILIFEVGHEKLRYLVGYCTVITSTAIQYVDIRQQALDLAAKLLNTPGYNTRTEY